MQIVLPWPPKLLSPNRKNKRDWRGPWSAGKKYKETCFYLAKTIKPSLSDKDIHLSITFHPKTKHKVDIDNCIASIKAGLDGIAEAWKVNDNRFKLHTAIGKPVKGGSVTIEVLT